MSAEPMRLESEICLELYNELGEIKERLAVIETEVKFIKSNWDTLKTWGVRLIKVAILGILGKLGIDANQVGLI